VASPEADVPPVRELVTACLPGYRVTSVVPVGGGLDNTAYEVNAELIVRFRRDQDADRLDREVRLLAAVAAALPVAVPQPVFADAQHACLAYRRLPGTPLLDLPLPRAAEHLTPIVTALRAFLAALHALPVSQLAELVDVDDQPSGDWLREAADTYPLVADRIPQPHRRAVETFLAAVPPEGGYTPTFCHNDLGIEHVLVDPADRTVTGVIDWSDAAIADPAVDLGRLSRDLGPAVLAAADDHSAGRATFYARCLLLEDLAYGLDTGQRRYVDKSLTALAWLFPA
jgi:aminoglycoside phosphotransferase (APT) family kinase protein